MPAPAHVPQPGLPNFVHLLTERAARTPSAELYRFLSDREGGDTGALDAARLTLRARAIAAELVEKGAAGERVLLVHPPGLEYIAGLFGVWFAGAVAVPAYPPQGNRNGSRLSGIVKDAGARFALTSASALGRMRSLMTREPELAKLQFIATDAIDDIAAERWQPPSTAADSVALLQYTSGSTGEPKGVVLTHAHFLDNARSLIAAVDRMRVGKPMGPDDRVVAWLPPYHDMGLLAGILTPLVAETPATLMSPVAFLQKPFRWLEAISREGGTISGGPNFGFELCVRRVTDAQRASLDLSSWTIALSGAERVRGDTMRRFSEAFATSGFDSAAWTPCYGLAEATLGVAFRPSRSGPPASKIVSAEALGTGQVVEVPPGPKTLELVECGRALPGTEILVVDPRTREPVADHRVGEIWVRSGSVALGYWENPVATRAAFGATVASAPPLSPRYLRTGDLGFLSQGDLYVTGRLKDLLIFGGLNYYPEDIEASVEGCHTCLRRTASAAFSVDRGEERLVVVCEVERPSDEEAAAAVEAIARRIAEVHELSVHDVVLVGPGGVPRTSSGKVRRSLCRDRYERSELDVVASLPRVLSQSKAEDAFVETVCVAMAEILGVARVAPEDDFFRLGAHSLMATQLVSRIREAFDVELSLRDVFQSTTPLGLAGRVAAAPRLGKLPEVSRVDRSGALPLTFSQERMWVLHRLDPSSAAYNVAGAVFAYGPLDVGALEKALQIAVQRHELLRSTYPTVDGRPVLRIAPTVEVKLPFTDLTSSQDPVHAARTRASALAELPFDVARDVLVRAELYRIGVDQHVLAVAMHHLITDAWSMGILSREVGEAYVAIREGRVPPGEPDAIGYVDYAGWQRSEAARHGMKALFDFWKTTLAGVEPVQLPTDRPRSRRRTSKGAFEPLPVARELLEAVHRFARSEGATPFMVLLAAFYTLLNRYTRQTDLVVGVPVANRNRLASERLIGTLVNTLPVRASVTADATFAELLAEVKEVCLDAYAHQDLPFERLVAELGVERRVGESPLVQVMFDYQNAPTDGRYMGDVLLEPLMISRGAAQFDLSLLVFDTQLGQLAGIEFATDLFERATIQRLLGHYVTLLGSAMAEPQVPVSRLAMLSGAEREGLLARANATFDVPRTRDAVHHLFEDRAAEDPSAPAVSDAFGTLTYGALDGVANTLAARLQRAGAGPGTRVAVFMERSTELVAALLAVLKTGAAYVPLDPQYPAARIDAVLDDAAPPVILAHSNLIERLSARDATVLAVEPHAPETAVPNFVPPQDTELTRPAYVLYTSGSTGKPKGVAVPVAALSNFLRSMSRNPGMNKADRVLSVTTVAFDIAGLELFLPLVNGASVHIASTDVIVDGPRLRELMLAVDPTLFQATPATFRLLVEAGWGGSPMLTVLCGGEAFPRDLAEQLLARAARVFNVYGPTETTIWSTVQEVESGDGAVPIGAPIDRTRLYVLDAHGSLVPMGVPGELCIGGDGVALGYHGRPDLTAERFVPDPFTSEADARFYKTGDLGRLRHDGAFECLGRLDEQIKLRGFRIEPAEIEAVLKETGTVSDVVVMAREVKKGDARLVAYYVPRDPAPDPQALREAVRKKLPPYMVPASFVELESMPRTPNGKVDRKAMPAPELHSSVDAAERVPPRDALERSITRVWEDVLEVVAPGIRDDFFSLGGHSLLAVRLLSQLERVHGVNLPIQALLEAPTIEALAQLIRVAGRSQTPIARRRRESYRSVVTPFRHLVPIQVRGKQAPLVCIHGAGGNVMNLSFLAHHLGENRPFYGVQARGVDGIEAPHGSVEDMAAAYLSELRVLSPNGPYYLSGYCGGGIVAFEMARMLRLEGDEVAFLGLIDTYRPGSIELPRFDWLSKVQASLEGLDYLVQQSKRGLLRNKDELARRAAIHWHRALQEPVPHELREIWLTEAFFKAVRTYRAQPFDGKLVVFRATDAHSLLATMPNMGWTGLAKSIDVLDVPGNHATIALEPNASMLGEQMLSRVTAADSARGKP